MKFIADLHIHSKFSRATSPRMDLENLNKWARIKGIKVLGSSDFTHPEWLDNLKEKLEPAEPGLFKLKGIKNSTRFVLSSEISCIYPKRGKTRKIHIIILAPDFKAVDKINTRLGWVGNLKSDGRPILGLDSEELVKYVLESSRDCLIIPAHLYTPWFSLFGSKSGFDSIEECFGEYSKYIYAGETGLSSSPPMSWRNSALDKISLVSNSDCHSPEKLGRETNVFDTELSYNGIIEAIKSKNPEKFLYTTEFYPQEGKYHYDGHRKCDIRLSPKESKKYNNVCPRCGRSLTVGVLHRVEDLADREEGFQPQDAVPFYSLIPLQEIIAEAKETNPKTKEVQTEYFNLIDKLGDEFKILLEVSQKDIEKFTIPQVAEGIFKARKGRVNIIPGYDGVFGEVKIFSKGEQKKLSKQNTLF